MYHNLLITNLETHDCVERVSASLMCHNNIAVYREV